LDLERREMNETRETATADMYPAIPGLVGDIASCRAEHSISFAQMRGH
jgi:hypothetical protein